MEENEAEAERFSLDDFQVLTPTYSSGHLARRVLNIGFSVFLLFVLCTFVLAAAAIVQLKSLEGPKATFHINTDSPTSKMQFNLTEFENDLQLVKAALSHFNGDFWFRPIPSNGYEYQLTTTTFQWRDGRVECQKGNGDLAVFGIMDFNVRLKIIDSLLRPMSVPFAWIGLSDLVLEGEWMWLNGTKGDNTTIGWAMGEPNNGAGNQNCGWLQATKNYFTDDGRCAERAKAICERKYKPEN